MLKFMFYFFWFVNFVILFFILGALTKWKFEGILLASGFFSFLLTAIQIAIIDAKKTKKKEQRLEYLKGICPDIPAFHLQRINYQILGQVSAHEEYSLDAEISIREQAVKLGANGLVIENESTNSRTVYGDAKVTKGFFGGVNVKQKSNTYINTKITAYALKIYK